MYSKTAIIYWGSGELGARTFTSETTLTDEQIITILQEDETKINSEWVKIIDTPQPEELNREIKVYIGQHFDALYLGWSVNGSWDNFWRVPDNLNGPGVITALRTIQKSGEIVPNIGWGNIWQGGRDALKMVATHDGDQLVFHLDQMNDRTKRLLRVL